MITNIIFGLFILLWLWATLMTVAKTMIWRSTHRRYKWLRKIYWNTVVDKLRDEYLGDYKIRSYFMKYLKKSLAAKNFYIKYGYDEFRVAMIGKIEELERFVKEYKYNTFDNLTPDEEEYIDNYFKKKK